MAGLKVVTRCGLATLRLACQKTCGMHGHLAFDASDGHKGSQLMPLSHPKRWFLVLSLSTGAAACQNNLLCACTRVMVRVCGERGAVMLDAYL